jgi:hypothetical protein
VPVAIGRAVQEVISAITATPYVIWRQRIAEPRADL